MAVIYINDRAVWLHRRQGSKFWQFSVDQGKHWKTTKKITKKAAREWLIERFEGEVGPSEKADLPFYQYAQVEFNNYAMAREASGRPLSANYIKDGKSYIERFIQDDPIGMQPARSITPGDFEDFGTRLLQKNQHRKTSVERSLEIARLVLRRGWKRKELRHNPTEGIEQIRVSHRERSIYTPEDLNKLFKKDVWETGDFTPWQDEYDYVAFILAVCTGMRRGEILAMEWPAVDFERGIITVGKALGKDGRLGETKGRKIRYTPIFDFVLWLDRRALIALSNLRERQQTARIRPITQGVFSYPDGSSRKQTWWRQRYTEALKTAKINRRREPDKLPLDGHSFRHTLASHLKGAGVGDDLIRQFCGWSCARMQANYTHLEPEVIERVMATVATARGS